MSIKQVSILALLLTIGTAAPGVQPAKAAQPQTLDTVVVTAGRLPEKSRNVTQSVTIIGREDIEKGQYKTTAEMLRSKGIQIDANGSGHETLTPVTMRGVRTSLMGNGQGGVLILLDGRRIATDNISLVPTVNIERIEILRGPASVQYGSSAVGGVINIITKRAGKDLGVSLEAGAGSWDNYRGQAEFELQKNGFDLSGGVSAQTLGSYKTGSDKTYKNTDADQKTTYSFNAGYSFAEEHRLGVKILGVKYSDIGSPSYFEQETTAAYSASSNYSVDVDYSGGINDMGLGWMARYYKGQYDYKYSDPASMFGAYTSKDVMQYDGFQGQLNFTRGIFSLTGGLDLAYSNSKSTQPMATPKNKYENTGLFALAKLTLLDERVIVSGGVRYDDYNVKYDGDKESFDHTTPSVGIAWHTTDWLTLRANYGESFRIAQAQEILGYSNGWTNYIGNKDLDPEEGESWDVGVEVNWQGLNVGLTYFSTNYKNKIIADATPAGMQYVNLAGKVKYRGIEAQAAFDAGSFFNWSFSLRPYANLTHMLKYEDQTGTTVPNVSRLDIAYGIGFMHPEWGTDIDLRFNYFGRQKQADFVSSWSGDIVETGNTTIADIFLSQRLMEWEDAGKLTLKAEVRNIFDKDYEHVLGYSMPGRSFYLGLRYEY